LERFDAMFADDALVIDKWFMRARSLIGTFCQGNPA
jgi:hypothetical protein